MFFTERFQAFCPQIFLRFHFQRNNRSSSLLFVPYESVHSLKAIVLPAQNILPLILFSPVHRYIFYFSSPAASESNSIQDSVLEPMKSWRVLKNPVDNNSTDSSVSV